MNSRKMLWVSVAILSLIVSASTPLFPVIFALLIMGVIPETNFMIPSWFMLFFYPLMFVCIIAALIGQYYFKKPSATTPKRKKAVRSQSSTRSTQVKKPTRRYSQAAKAQKA